MGRHLSRTEAIREAREVAKAREWGSGRGREEGGLYRGRERWGGALTLGPWSGGVAPGDEEEVAAEGRRGGW